MHETKFENGSEITPYLAIAYAEGFEECSMHDQMCAWSYLLGTRLAFILQGFFGRAVTYMVEAGHMSEDGTVDWNYINELIA